MLGFGKDNGRNIKGKDNNTHKRKTPNISWKFRKRWKKTKKKTNQNTKQKTNHNKSKRSFYNCVFGKKTTKRQI